MTTFDLEQTDLLLSTTRSVRKRLDFDREVPREVILECLQLAVQAPTGSNSQGWRWIVVDDPDKKQALADLYRTGGEWYLQAAADNPGDDQQTNRVITSALYLAKNLEKAPVLVIPCIRGSIHDTSVMSGAALFGSILPAVWSFQLALRSRGLGSCLTTLHLFNKDEADALLGIPAGVSQVALLPVAYTLGTDFKPADRDDVSSITYWNSWSD